MRIARLFPALLLCALLALLAACGKDKDKAPAVDNTTPEAAVLATAQQLQKGDFDSLWQHLLPPADYKAMRADWGKDRGDLAEVTAEDRQKFAEGMQRITAPDAESVLFEQVKPQLDAFDQKYKAQLPLMIGMAQTVAGTQIDNSKELALEQKQQAKETLDALAQWAQQVPWGDQAKAREAIAVVVATARELDIKTLDQAYALDYDAAMKKYAQIWAGVKQVLGVYGLSLDDTLNSLKAKTLENDGNNARVGLSYTLVGKPLSGEVAMVREDGRWYPRDFLTNWRQQHAKAAAAASTQAPGTDAAAATAGSAG